MSRSKGRLPAYRLHKPSGQAVVTLGGRDHYLGVYDPRPESPSYREYTRLIAEHLAADQRPVLSSATVADLCAAYLRHAQGYHRPNQYVRVRRAVKAVVQLYGDQAASAFGPKAMKAVQTQFVRDGLCRTYINCLHRCILAAWKWAVSEELVPHESYAALTSVATLHLGHTDAREPVRIQAVPWEHVEPVLAHVLPTVADMIRLQALTGARAGEITLLRPCDLDRETLKVDGVPIWVYRPATHKTQHKGHGRALVLGPQAQAVLAPYLERPPDRYCFSPREATERYLREQGRVVRHGRCRQPGERYTTGSYDRAVAKGCRRAGVPRWHPHQLRHRMATLASALAGREAASATLGHQSLQITALYDHSLLEKAARVVLKLG